MAISTSQKLLQLQKKKEQLDKEICGLKEKNMLLLASALATISAIKSLDINVILGMVLSTIKDIKEEDKEVLAHAGRTFLKKYKARITTNKNNKADSKKE